MNVVRWFKHFFSTERPPIDVKRIEEKIGYRFRDKNLLYMSLKHRSYTQVTEAGTGCSNERLEFLGDTVLNMVVSHSIYTEHPDFNEGDLTKLKSVLVSGNIAGIAGKKLGIDNFVLISDSEENTGGRARTSIISDAFEAIIGAIFLDGGLKPAREFVTKTILSDSEYLQSRDQKNYKSLLLELTQAEGLGYPKYRTISEDGPDHDKTFNVVVFISGESRGSGKGKSKKIAQQMAAKSYFERFQNGHEVNKL